jgi:predicted RNase H-like nuclease (RuvC/YqgF family)
LHQRIIITWSIGNMAIMDWFKEIPLSAILKEKLTDLEKENISLKNKVTELEVKVSQFESEIVVLNASISDLQEQRRALDKQIIEIQNNPLKFDKKTGTWLSSVDNFRYCTKCNDAGKKTPLKETERGWVCKVCNASYSDPSREPKIQPFTPFDPSVGY